MAVGAPPGGGLAGCKFEPLRGGLRVGRETESEAAGCKVGRVCRWSPLERACRAVVLSAWSQAVAMEWA
eukprot:2079250-Heterocapsa_arctica.AAC.1